MPKKTLITRTLNRQHQKDNMNDLPVLHHSKKFERPDEFKDFLTCDSGTEDPERILTFGQQTLLELLDTAQQLWLADGIFKLCPEIFFHFFTIHTSINGYHPPCIYALVPNKLEKKNMSTIADNWLRKVPNSSPTRILVDSEKAVMNAFQRTLTDSTLSGCYFYVCQSFVRKK